METNTKGDGSVWEIAFSKDPQEKYMYVADGSNHKIHVFDRLALTEIYSLRQRRASARRMVRAAQHRDRLQGQHLYDGDLSRPARAEVHLQGHRGRDRAERRRAVAGRQEVS